MEDSLRPYISDVMCSMKTQSGTGYIYTIVIIYCQLINKIQLKIRIM
ncbi:Rpn family recombination-promoting nuclease/putative transposase [Photobacterium damselae]